MRRSMAPRGPRAKVDGATCQVEGGRWKVGGTRRYAQAAWSGAQGTRPVTERPRASVATRQAGSGKLSGSSMPSLVVVAMRALSLFSAVLTLTTAAGLEKLASVQRMGSA